MENLKKEIEKTIEGMLPEMGKNIYSSYKSILAVSAILSAIPAITYFLIK